MVETNYTITPGAWHELSISDVSEFTLFHLDGGDCVLRFGVDDTLPAAIVVAGRPLTTPLEQVAIADISFVAGANRVFIRTLGEAAKVFYADNAAAPSNSVAPTVSGDTDHGSTLTVDPGTWAGAESFTYQWTLDGSPIVDATDDEYVSLVGQVGSDIGCDVVGVNATGSSAPVSSGNVITVTAP